MADHPIEELNPGAPSEVSPFPLKDRAEISGRVGWRGMGFVLDDMEASITRYGLPTVRRIFSDNGIRHVELEFLLDWHLDGEKRLASDSVRAPSDVRQSRAQSRRTLLGPDELGGGAEPVRASN